MAAVDLESDINDFKKLQFCLVILVLVLNKMHVVSRFVGENSIKCRQQAINYFMPYFTCQA